MAVRIVRPDAVGSETSWGTGSFSKVSSSDAASSIRRIVDLRRMEGEYVPTGARLTESNYHCNQQGHEQAAQEQEATIRNQETPQNRMEKE